MSRFPSLLCFVIALPALAFAGVCARGQDQSFLGRPAASWADQLADRDAGQRRSAAFALGKIGPAAGLEAARLINALHDSDPAVREAAAFALGEIGPTDAANRPLPGAGRAAQTLLELLEKDQDARVRRSAAYALGRYGFWARSAAGSLQKALADREAPVRQNAAWALGQIGPEAGPEAIGSLGRVLGDGDALVRRDAALALGKMGQEARKGGSDVERWNEARKALPELMNHWKHDPEPAVKKVAMEALVNLVGPEDQKLAGDLRKALHDNDPDTARNAALGLGNIGGPDAIDAVPVLARALKDDDVMVRRQAATALANIGPHAGEAVAELTAALQGDRDLEVRGRAALALGRIGSTARAAIPELVRALEPIDTEQARQDPAKAEEVRKYAAEALGYIDPQAPEVVKGLLRLLNEKGAYRARHRAIWALERLREFEQPGVVEAMAKTLFDDSEQARPLRYEAAKVLALRLGERVPDKTLEVLLEALRDKNLKIYKGTGASVSGSGAEAKTGQTSVKETGEGDWRRVVAEAVARVGKRAAKPDLLAALEKVAEESVDEDARKAARDALRELRK
jgi:HEAT repeat protein